MKLLYSLLFILFATTVAQAAPVTVTWDLNPPEEQVTVYHVYVDDVKTWTGAVPPATLQLTPGVHKIEATAENMWAESSRSVPVNTPWTATAPRNIIITITVTVP